MIAEDKDRLECLRLAVVLMTPKAAGQSPKDAIANTLDAARRFYAFTRGDEGASTDGATPRVPGRS